MTASRNGTAVVITSCGRFDLLRRTVTSLLLHEPDNVAQYILVEDSGQPDVLEVLEDFPVAFEVIINDPPIGQIASIDRAYSRVNHEWIFHCEDDWDFTRGGFIAESRRVLMAAPWVSMVNAVHWGVLDVLDGAVSSSQGSIIGGVRCHVIAVDAHPPWFGYSFNPGLRRTADWRLVGPFASLGHEPEVSLAFKRLGMSMAVLEDRAWLHTGDGRHVRDPVAPIERSPAFLDYHRRLMGSHQSPDS